MVQLRETLFLEKQKTIDAMREELEQERRDISTRSEERYGNQVAELEAIIKVEHSVCETCVNDDFTSFSSSKS